MSERMVNVTIVETIHYYREVPLSHIEEVAAMTLEECGDLNSLMAEYQSAVSQGAYPGEAEWLEGNAEIQCQDWRGEFAEVTDAEG